MSPRGFRGSVLLAAVACLACCFPLLAGGVAGLLAVAGGYLFVAGAGLVAVFLVTASVLVFLTVRQKRPREEQRQLVVLLEPGGDR